MNKKQNSAILAGIAITAILVASSLIAGNQFTQQAHAQATTTPPSTTATPSTPTAPKPTAGTPEPRVGQTVNWQGTVSSIPSPLAGKGRDNVAIILPVRKDGGLYTGVVTFTSSKNVMVQVWNLLTGVAPGMNIGRGFGSLAISPSPEGKGFIATTEVGSGDTSGSVPFAGNALALVGRSPFIATYSLTATTAAGKVTNNLTSATALAAAAGGAAGGGGAAATTLGGTSGETGALTLGGTSGGGGSSGAAPSGRSSGAAPSGAAPSGAAPSGRSSGDDNGGG
jgi:hypothetical protein